MPMKSIDRMLLEARIFDRPIELSTVHLDLETLRYLDETRSTPTVYVQRVRMTHGVRYDVTALTTAVTDEAVPSCLRDTILCIAAHDRSHAQRYRLSFAPDMDETPDLPLMSPVRLPETCHPYVARLSERHFDKESLAYLEEVCDNRYRRSPCRVCKLMQWGHTTQYFMTVYSTCLDRYDDLPQPLRDVLEYLMTIYGDDPDAFPAIAISRGTRPLTGTLPVYPHSEEKSGK